MLVSTGFVEVREGLGSSELRVPAVLPAEVQRAVLELELECQEVGAGHRSECLSQEKFLEKAKLALGHRKN